MNFFSKLFIGLLFIFIFLNSFECEKSSNLDLELTLRWCKAYPDEDSAKIITGFAWAMSYLGAELAQGSLNKAIVWKNDSHLQVDFSKLGFNTSAEKTLASLIDILKKNEEYIQRGGIDLGRFISLTINSTNHYFAITNVYPTLQDFKRQYIFNRKAGILESSVAHTNRLIETVYTDKVEEIASVAYEGTGQLEDGTFKIKEYETVDLMPNGQFRFALYDRQGRLKTAGSPKLSIAGKPAKCIWCHEIYYQPYFKTASFSADDMSSEEFNELALHLNKIVDTYRKTLKSDIDFKRKQDHQFMELLYISFMEPSPQRLSAEWGMPVDDIKKNLSNFESHNHYEFKFLKNLYQRAAIDRLAPYKTIKTPSSAREFSNYEPDLIRFTPYLD